MTISEFSQHIFSIYQRFYGCFQVDDPDFQCQQMMGLTYLWAIFILFIFFVFKTRQILTERREWLTYLKRKEQRAAVADSETMAKHVWRGDD